MLPPLEAEKYLTNFASVFDDISRELPMHGHKLDAYLPLTTFELTGAFLFNSRFDATTNPRPGTKEFVDHTLGIIQGEAHIGFLPKILWKTTHAKELREMFKHLDYVLAFGKTLIDSEVKKLKENPRRFPTFPFSCFLEGV